MQNDKICFVAVEFIADEIAKGNFYWYLCESDGVQIGDAVIAPLGRHNDLRQGFVREILYETEKKAPFPLNSIKYIRSIVKSEKTNVQDCQ